MVPFMTRCLGRFWKLLLAAVSLAAGGCTYSKYGDYRYPYDSRYNGHPVVNPPIFSWSDRARI